MAREHRPKVIVAGYTAYSRSIDFERFGQIAEEVGAVLMVDMAHISGLIAAGVHQSPVPYAQVITSTTHKSLRGPRGALIMSTENHRRAIDRAVFPYAQGGPLMHAIAAKAVCFGEALRPDFKEYGQAIVSNAKTLASTLERAGLRLVSGGTDNHLMLVDVRALEITGVEAEETLGRVGITVNKNAIPNDPEPFRVTSGLRLGTPSITTRGFGEAECRQVGELIVKALNHCGDEKAETEVREAVIALTSRFPVPGLENMT